MAFIAASIIGGTAAIAGGALSASAAGSAAEKQAAATRDANNLQYKMFQQTREDQTPWREAGMRALAGLGNPDFQRDFNINDFGNDPGYAFRMQEGQKALERSAAARGGLFGGAFGKALTRYGQDYASNEYQNAYNRFNNDRNNRFNRLSSIAGVGQTANNAIQNAGMNYANQTGNNLTNLANAQGASGIAQASAWGGALGGIANSAMNYQNMNWMDRWMDKKYGGPSTPQIPQNPTKP